ncbi:MAG: SDR family NAD(P)-dependent oxidoreductase [Porticoccaceae bacterium]|jgi:NAD(P)-dependent dehydrogenase (short-subunit alcohol dehydrogenase family)|nr:SDR family NAD(P)-dependent oxidoreductase [Porticoccaceae bacterium]MEA3300141.1 SDR family NAD(P)-dependent oxidoreductase [Pseudomonadota bacterium]
MNQRFQDRVVLITGTGGGMGREAALRFAAEGARVVGCDVKADGNRETVELVRQRGGTIDTMEPVDLGDPAQARRWVEDAAALHGRIDILYNNASACRFAPIGEFPIEDWQFTIRNELDLVFYVTRYAWPWLKRQGGVIINTGSIAGMAGSGPGGAAHAATKGAVIALTKQLAQEGAEHNIRAVTVSPGFIETPGTADFANNPQIREGLIARNIIQRIGKAEDVVNMALFLASDEASFITGANYVVDGGRTSR